MKTLYFVLVCGAVLFSVGFGKKLHLQTQQTRNPELNGGFVEGDLKLTAEQKSVLYASPVDRSGLVNKRYRWPGSLVWYKFAGDIGEFFIFFFVNFFFILHTKPNLFYLGKF